jgi:hypothetical protein
VEDTRQSLEDNASSIPYKNMVRNYSRSISNDPKMYHTPQTEYSIPSIPSTTSGIISNSFEGSPLAASSPKDTYMESPNPLQINNPPAVPPRRSSFSNAISAGNEQPRMVDAVKLTEDEFTKISQERKPLDRLAKLNSLKEKETSLIHDMIMNRY